MKQYFMYQNIKKNIKKYEKINFYFISVRHGYHDARRRAGKLTRILTGFNLLFWNSIVWGTNKFYLLFRLFYFLLHKVKSEQFCWNMKEHFFMRFCIRFYIRFCIRFVYVFVYLFVYGFVHVFVYVFVCVFKCIFVCVFVCVFVYVFVCVCVYANTKDVGTPKTFSSDVGKTLFVYTQIPRM